MANSYREGGRCIAGISAQGGGWIRPVTPGTGALGENRCRHFGLLDVIRVNLGAHQPEPHQPENWLLAGLNIANVRTLTPGESWRVLENAVVPGPKLFGTRDRLIPFADCEKFPVTASLAVVTPEGAEWSVEPRPYSAYPQVRCSFSLSGQEYLLPVTDPWWLAKFKNVPVGQRMPSTFGGVGIRDRLLLTVSLGGPLRGNCYKLVAGVIVLEGVRR